MDRSRTDNLDRAHAYTRANLNGRLYRPCWKTLGLLAGTFAGRRTIGLENIPTDGPVLLAPNHVSSWDHCLVVADAGRPLTIMAKSELFHFPLNRFRSSIGAFPVRRGVGDEEALITARTVLGLGGIVLIYCEGTRSRTGPGNGRPRPGVGKLALETGAPVVPVAIRWTSRPGPRRREVSVSYGQPHSYDGDDRAGAEAITMDIYERIVDLYREANRQSIDGRSPQPTT